MQVNSVSNPMMRNQSKQVNFSGIKEIGENLGKAVESSQRAVLFTNDSDKYERQTEELINNAISDEKFDDFLKLNFEGLDKLRAESKILGWPRSVQIKDIATEYGGTSGDSLKAKIKGYGMFLQKLFNADKQMTGESKVREDLYYIASYMAPKLDTTDVLKLNTTMKEPTYKKLQYLEFPEIDYVDV